MKEDLVLQLAQNAMTTTAMVSAPMLISALLIGLLVSIFQAITQINEATLTFIPKMIVVGVVLLFAGPWIIDIMSTFTIELFENLPDMVRQ